MKDKTKIDVFSLKPVRISQDLHAAILAEHQKTHRDFWAIASDAMRLGLEQMGLIKKQS